MSFDDLFRRDRPNKTLQRTADQHCDFTMTDNLKLDMAFDAHRLAVAELGRYRLRPEPLMERDAWLVPFRRFWSKHVDALEHHLEKTEKVPSMKGKERHEQP